MNIIKISFSFSRVNFFPCPVLLFSSSYLIRAKYFISRPLPDWLLTILIGHVGIPDMEQVVHGRSPRPFLRVAV